MLLDTCALLWLASGAGRLSPAALNRINEAPAVYVSAISGFEIALKAARGKLGLPVAPKEWFERLIHHHGLAGVSQVMSFLSSSSRRPTLASVARGSAPAS
jgi:PIN domain nuclease of toxin-antitoxin system